ncbi:acyltransferase family protein [Leptobacterium sp. I13]|uniref:acyltransferase family protein n=1 Tax=Leptobacterium meishanense TaxID=3128904 RepID=UPI0030ED52C4
METFKTKKVRKYYLDWLRILLILSVFMFHIGMFFNGWNWHIKNNQQYEWLHPIMEFLHLWRMPLLFLTSGVGTFFALGFRTPGQYLKERFKRIFIPFLIGIFTLVPVQVYIEKASQYDSLISYYPHMFDGIYPIGNFSWHHLWFLIYLFTMALLIFPFLNSLRSEKFNRHKERFIKIVSKPLGLNLIVIPIIFSEYLLRPYFPEVTHALFNDWAYISFCFIYFLSGFILISNDDLVSTLKQQAHLYFLEGVLFTFLMFTVPSFFEDELIAKYAYGLLRIFVAWAVSMAAIGYTRKYLNRDSKYRKALNEAIYPFYLLHQPVIVVMGYYVAKWQINNLVKFFLLTVICFTVIVLIYQFLIRPFNIIRILFGLKPIIRNMHNNNIN